MGKKGPQSSVSCCLLAARAPSMTPALPPKGKQSSLCLCLALRSSHDFLCPCCSLETTPGPNLSSFLKPLGRQRGQCILL